MIKFFRKIRQNLLTENRYSKYLLYAIGEIALVMIGILLALQINNWNEDKKNQILVKTYVSNLIENLIIDSTNITKTIGNIEKELIVLEEFEKRV
jgi:hypothetical protein